MKSKKKETKNTEPARNVALEELIKIIPGEVKRERMEGGREEAKEGGRETAYTKDKANGERW